MMKISVVATSNRKKKFKSAISQQTKIESSIGSTRIVLLNEILKHIRIKQKTEFTGIQRTALN